MTKLFAVALAIGLTACSGTGTGSSSTDEKLPFHVSAMQVTGGYAYCDYALDGTNTYVGWCDQNTRTMDGTCFVFDWTGGSPGKGEVQGDHTVSIGSVPTCYASPDDAFIQQNLAGVRTIAGLDPENVWDPTTQSWYVVFDVPNPSISGSVDLVNKSWTITTSAGTFHGASRGPLSAYTVYGADWYMLLSISPDGFALVRESTIGLNGNNALQLNP